MDLGVDLSIYFKKYEELRNQVDEVFARMKNDFPLEVKCDNGCTDCCYALFDLSLVEALYLNLKFSQLPSQVRNEVLLEADKADRKIHKIKKTLSKAQSEGQDEKELLEKASREKVRCPLLKDDKCVAYQDRPITCRLYGIPMNTGHVSATCALSGFEPGKEYPTVHMNKIFDRLAGLSEEIAVAINTRYPQLHTVLVPVSMCLLTEYGKGYLGIKDKPKAAPKEAPTREWVLGPRED